ncbi:hypothetical protein ASU28_10500 [Lactiplantibacillus paraplantarum]|uniref:spr1630 family ClpXP-sensitive toxin n=1 Tax=Lactiplantibacillus paraplantarum TaxID=60520 RepID=UPI000513E43D|nr:hypothetical protein [Lactiplantibacillus paraplantarum]ALO04747.1 hypothetical protein ASU28_10500 [Lactiplantibacillus paraplantarum]KGE74155.1 hypothetical protein HR47_13530 [Lactiplantibacillus paraplantarum]
MTELPLLNDDVKKLLVDATRTGFVEYLTERIQKKESMEVSGGYAWTRSNHIDDNIAKDLNEKKLGSYSLHKAAGWDFLRFEFEINHQSIWIAQKGSAFLNKKSNLAKKEDLHKNYISQWSENVNEPYSGLFTGNSEQLNLLDDALNMPNDQQIDVRKLESADAFYLLIYNIDKGIDIDKMSLNLVYDGQIKLIEDLSELNAASEVKIPDEFMNNNTLSKDFDPDKEPSSGYLYYDNPEIKAVKENTREKK